MGQLNPAVNGMSFRSPAARVEVLAAPGPVPVSSSVEQTLCEHPQGEARRERDGDAGVPLPPDRHAGTCARVIPEQVSCGTL